MTLQYRDHNLKCTSLGFGSFLSSIIILISVSGRQSSCQVFKETWREPFQEALMLPSKKQKARECSCCPAVPMLSPLIPPFVKPVLLFSFRAVGFFLRQRPIFFYADYPSTMPYVGTPCHIHYLLLIYTKLGVNSVTFILFLFCYSGSS